MSAATGRADNRPVVFMGKYPDETFTYSLSLTAVIGDKTVERVVVASAPSGVGELTLTNLNCDGENATVVIADGQPGRIYSFKYAITLDTGEVRELLATLTVSRVLITDQPDLPQSEGFGPTLRWPPSNVAIYGHSKYGDGSVYGGAF